MKQLIIQKKSLSKHIKRTISWHGNTYDLLCELCEDMNISFNYLVNYLIEYMIDNYQIDIEE